jgi:hypothetical protein
VERLLMDIAPAATQTEDGRRATRSERDGGAAV